MQFTKQQLQRFWSKVKIGDRCSCWEWLASRRTARPGRLGYGQVHINGRNLPAHRVAFAMVHGRYPKGLVMHCCDNPVCVNPYHLKEGTHQDNMDDMTSKGRQGKKLSLPDVIKIKRSKKSAHVLAQKYGVSNRSIRNIRNGVTWSTV